MRKVIQITSILLMTIAWPIGYLLGLKSVQVSRIVQILVPLICICGVVATSRLPIKGFPKVIYLYLIISLVYVLIAEPDKPKALFHYLSYVTVIWVCFCYLNKAGDGSFILKVTFWAMLLTGLLTVVAEYIKPSHNPWPDRLAMSWANPVWISHLAVFSIISVIVLEFFRSKSAGIAGKREKTLLSNVIKATLCLVIIGGNLLLMYRGTSVGAALFLVMTLIIFLLQKGKQRLKYAILLVAIFFILFYGGYINNVIYKYKYRIFDQRNYETRLNTYFMTMDFVKDNLWFGLGWTDSRFLDLRESYNYRSEAGWAIMLLEMGLIRLFLLVSLFVYILAKYVKRKEGNADIYQMTAALSFAGLVANGYEALYVSLSGPFPYVLMILWGQLYLHTRKRGAR